jgi:hypothetical protein
VGRGVAPFRRPGRRNRPWILSGRCYLR